MHSVDLEKEKSISALVIRNNPCWDCVLDSSFHFGSAFNYVNKYDPYILNITPLFHEALGNSY